MTQAPNPPKKSVPETQLGTRLSETTVVVVLEVLEETLEEYPLPRLIHINDGHLAAPVVPMLVWALTKGGNEPATLVLGPMKPLGIAGAMGTDDGPVLLDLERREASVLEPLIRRIETLRKETPGAVVSLRPSYVVEDRVTDQLAGYGIVTLWDNPGPSLARAGPARGLRKAGTGWVELRGYPVSGSLEIRECDGEIPVSYEATFQVELAGGGKVELMRSHGDRSEIERQCQEIFVAGDVVVSGPLVLLEAGLLVVVTKWEPVKEA